MTKNTERKVNIKSLPPDRQRKVRKMRARLKKGSYSIVEKVVDDKTVDGSADDIRKS